MRLRENNKIIPWVVKKKYCSRLEKWNKEETPPLRCHELPLHLAIFPRLSSRLPVVIRRLWSHKRLRKEWRADRNRACLRKIVPLERGVKLFSIIGRYMRLDHAYMEDSYNSELSHAFPFDNYFIGNTFKHRYKCRIRITIGALLLETSNQANRTGTSSLYIHLGAMGLGAWAIHREQTLWNLMTFAGGSYPQSVWHWYIHLSSLYEERLIIWFYTEHAGQQESEKQSSDSMWSRHSTVAQQRNAVDIPNIWLVNKSLAFTNLWCLYLSEQLKVPHLRLSIVISG